MTKVRETHVPDDVFALARRYFTEDELVKLTLAVVTINGWNRFAISFRSEPGVYQPTPEPEEHTEDQIGGITDQDGQHP